MPVSNENQAFFLNKLREYLTVIAQARPTVYDPDNVLARLQALQYGHCSGITALWLYYKKRNKHKYFYNFIMSPILAWDGTKETLSKELEEVMEYALSVSVSLQHGHPAFSGMTAYAQTPFEQSSVQQSDYDVLINLLKEDEYPNLRKEYEIAFIFNKNELKELLESFLPDKLIRLSSSNHTIGLFCDGQEYVLFDPNGFVQEGTQERFFEKRFAVNEVENLVKNIQSAFIYTLGLNMTGLTISVFDDVQKPMPVYLDRVKRVRQLLYARQSAGVIDIDEANLYDGASALWFASKEGHLDMVEFLLSRGADIHKIANDDSSCMHIAAEQGHTEVIRTLLNAGAQALIHAPDKKDLTPLCYAAIYGHLETVQLLLGKGAKIENNELGLSPIYLALIRGFSTIVEALLNSHAGVGLVNRPTHEGIIPLFYAVLNGHIDTVRLLLQLGSLIRNDIYNPIVIASEKGYSVILEALLDTPAGQALIEVPDADGITPLYAAAQNGHFAVVKVLLERGATIMNGQMNPILAAQKNEHYGIAAFLIAQKRAKLQVRFSPIYNAVGKKESDNLPESKVAVTLDVPEALKKPANKPKKPRKSKR